MQRARIDAEATLGVKRGEVVVGITATGPGADAAATLRSVLRHTPEATRLVVIGGDPAPPDEAGRARIASRADTVAAAIAAAAPADFALVGSPCLVGEGWLERLRAAAHADLDVATATPLMLELPDGMSTEAAAAAVASAARGLRPHLGAPRPHCVYVRRSAVELVGGYDAEFATRCASRGLRHLLADDVLVAAPAPGDPPEDTPALRRATGVARRALRGLTVTIDARNLSGPPDGTRVHVLELIAALSRTGEAAITAVVPSDLDSDSARILARLPRVIASSTPRAGADLVHRPFQISSPADLAYLAQLGERLVITHQDLISYRSASYFRDATDHDGYRRLTRDALAVADRALFFSAHVREEAIAEGLVEPHRASVIHIGVDHAVTAATTIAPRAPERAAELAEFMLCLGTDYQHKNRLFALAVVERLRREHDWDGRLVLAGPRMRFGSSAAQERRLLDERPELAAAVLTLDAVKETEKAWLLRHAALVLYPSVHEGLGLVPFEAAESGVPCLWAAGSGLAEFLPAGAARIVAWDAAATARHALALMREGGTRRANIEAVRAAAASLSWDAAATALLAVYRTVCDEPPAPAGAAARTGGLMRGGLSEDGVRLVGPNGALPRDVERPLLALASHPAVGKPVFTALRACYRACMRLQRRRTTP